MDHKIKKTICIILIIVAFALIYLSPYIVYKYEYLIGFDTGNYMYKTLTSQLTFWDDPLFFVFLTMTNENASTDIANLFIFLPLFIFPFICMGVYLINKSIFKKTKAQFIFSALFLMTSTILMKGFYESFYRQIFATILFLFFLYSVYLFFEKEKSIILPSLFFAAIILSHKGVAFLSFFVIIFASYQYSATKKNFLKNLLKILAISLLISSIYIIPLIPKYFTTLYESLLLTFKGASSISSIPREVVGRSLISDDGNINPLVDLFHFIPIMLFSIYGIVQSYMENKKPFFNVILMTILFLSLWIFFKGNFANRFIYNLSILLIIFIPVLLNDIKINKKIRLMFIFVIVLYLFISIIPYSLSQKPYITLNKEGIEYFDKLPKSKKTLIFAPDYLETVLAQKGYLVSQYYRELDFNFETNKYEDKYAMVQSDDFLVIGHSNISLLDKYNLTEYEIFVIFGEWDTTTALPRGSIKEPISKKLWDNSNYFTKEYEGEHEIVRIYRLK